MLEGIKYMDGFNIDILHCNDWHSSLVIPLKNTYYRGNTIYDNIRTVFTIHNILYQGIYGRDLLWMLGLDEKEYFTEDKLKYGEGISFMKWAILSADRVTTVSKTYSEEIRLQYLGYGLHNILERRKHLLTGIQNGIDYDAFNPKEDKNIYFNYHSDDLNSKHKNKLKLQEELGLSVDVNIPVIGMVTRLTDQKGIGLLEGVINELMSENIQLIITGTGENHYEEDFRYFESKYDNLKTVLRFDEGFSRKVYAGSDIFLMPSKFEPCGLGQLIAMRYGTVPVVRATGGLKDTVKDYNKYADDGEGFTFKEYDTVEFLNAIKRSLDVFNNNKDSWNRLSIRIMNKDSSWRLSAEKYKKLYRKLSKLK